MKPITLAIFFGMAVTAESAQNGQFIYAAQDDGTVRVYDINSTHAWVKTLSVFPGLCDARGIAVAAPTHRLYTMFNSPGQGHVACVDLRTDKVLWDHVIHSAVDRGDVTPDGKTLYVPSYEGLSNSPYEFVVDAITGNVISTIAMPIKTHDTICSLDGTKVFMENKSSDARIRTVSTATNQVIATTAKFAGVVQPFAVNGKNTFVIADVIGIYGFQYANLTTGQVLGTARFVGTTWRDPGITHPHGIGMTPNEHEAWVCDRGTGNHFVHVFDISALPPRENHLITVTNDNPHWLTFTIDGRYCYVAGAKNAGRNTDIVSTATYARVGIIPPSEDLLEVDFTNGVVTAVGSQFGVGRASAAPTPTPTPAPSVVRINCGGPAYTDSLGQLWSADNSFVGGSTKTYSPTQSVSGTPDAKLYQSERYAQQLIYNITVPNGSYNVTFSFAEMYFNAAGNRVFSVSLEGQTVLQDLDIWALVGQFAALQRTFKVTVNNGVLNIVGTASVNNAQLAAVEVTPSTGN